MKAYAFTAIGPRPNNEDTILVDHQVFVNAAKADFEETALLAVFDGVGGSPRGEEASLAAANTLSQLFDPSMDVEAFHLCLYQCHVAVRALSSAETGPFSTVVGVVRLKDGYYGFNLGDSIALVFRGGKLHQVSIDDCTAPGLYELGVHCPSYITYCLGQSSLEPEDFHIVPLELSKGDVALVASDGITNAVPYPQMEDILMGSFDGKEQFEAIIARAKENGPEDNYSLILAEI